MADKQQFSPLCNCSCLVKPNTVWHSLQTLGVKPSVSASYWKLNQGQGAPALGYISGRTKIPERSCPSSVVFCECLFPLLWPALYNVVRINWAFQNLGHSSLTQPVSGGLVHGIHLTESEENTVLFPSPFPGVCFLSEFLNFKKYPSAHNSEFLRSRECNLRVTVWEKDFCSIVLSLSKDWPICSCERTSNFQAVQMFLVLQDMILEYLSYLSHLLSRDVHFTVATVALKVLESCWKVGQPKLISDLSSAIPITAASESQAGAGSH